MRCIVCDRCKKIVEDERKIKVVTYARPLDIHHPVKSPQRADDRTMSDPIWTRDLCPACAEEFENFMNPSATPAPAPSPGGSAGAAV